MQTLKQISILKLSIQLLLSLSAMILLFSCSKESSVPKDEPSPTISAHASDRTSTVAVPYFNTVFVPCANGGAGEYVHISGSTNFLNTISWTDHGFTFGYHANTYRIEGTGVISGEKFVGSAHTEGQVFGSFVNSQWVYSFVDQIKLNGSSTSFLLKNKYHITVNPDGDVEVVLKGQETDCK
jgi:hypothetical protein